MSPRCAADKPPPGSRWTPHSHPKRDLAPPTGEASRFGWFRSSKPEVTGFDFGARAVATSRSLPRAIARPIGSATSNKPITTKVIEGFANNYSRCGSNDVGQMIRSNPTV